MTKIYNITNPSNLYWIDPEYADTRYRIKTFSKEWWKLIYKLIPHLKFKFYFEF